MFKCSQITKSWMRERPLCGICTGKNNYGEKKKAENSVELFFKTVYNTNPAKTIVQKVTKQQSLGLMQYRLYRNSHDEMCRSGTVNIKEPRRRLIFQTTVCVLDISPKSPYNKQTSRSAQQAMVEVCSPEVTTEKQVSWGHEDPQRAEWEQHLVYSHVLWRRMWASLNCSDYWKLVITSHSTSFSLNVSLTSKNEGACPC